MFGNRVDALLPLDHNGRKESCHKYTNESCHTYTNESCHTYMNESSFPYMNKSCDTWIKFSTFSPDHNGRVEFLCVDFFCSTVAWGRLAITAMGGLRLVGSSRLYVSFAKEPYKRDYILQKRHIILRSVLIVATPYQLPKRALAGLVFEFCCTIDRVGWYVCIYTCVYIYICMYIYIYMYV